ncbi:hypothetical protein KBX35_01365 [Micromonospora sp. C32]|uniref:hypothetical protein n=1 Tax=unclassified Micromonospora TaxID=2617518 RepID=UPI001B35FB5F|nr:MULTISPECIES: hypothetical protein [unclassified Micromonospora]MBQ1041524.1 hypothetical protein [Micromonospora sp. C72]MBQ1053431.1 hypothetical protein [Micromonospora sp. C32]
MVIVRRFDNADALAVAGLIERCLREANSHDYPSEVIERMCEHFTEHRIKELATQRQIFVAEESGIIGTVSRDGNKVYTMFVHPRPPVTA